MIGEILNGYNAPNGTALHLAQVVRRAVFGTYNRAEEIARLQKLEEALKQRFDAFTDQREVAAQPRLRAAVGGREWITHIFAPVVLSAAQNDDSPRLLTYPFRKYDIEYERKTTLVVTSDPEEPHLYSDVGTGVEQLAEKSYGFFVTPRNIEGILASNAVSAPWSLEDHNVGVIDRIVPRGYQDIQPDSRYELAGAKFGAFLAELTAVEAARR
jgi:hypothetical protein